MLFFKLKEDMLLLPLLLANMELALEPVLKMDDIIEGMPPENNFFFSAASSRISKNRRNLE